MSFAKSLVRVLLFAIFVALLFLGNADKTFAVTVSFTSYPSTIADDSFTLTASISGASNGTNYLRVDIYKDQTTNYFGETYNGTDWYGGSTYSQYFPITIASGGWQGSLQARIGSPTSGQYDGQGIYKMRLRRYTSGGGNTASEANNSAVVVAIALPTVTPTPTDVPTDTPAPAPTNAPTSKTATPTPTKSPTPSPKTSIQPTEDFDILEGTSDARILGTESAVKKPTPFGTKIASERTANSKLNVALVVGGILLASCGILLFRQIRNK